MWQGALLLADYLLEQQEALAGCVALEVGAGTGLAGLVLSRTARRVFLTDCERSVLDNCQAGAGLQSHAYPHSTASLVHAFVRFQEQIDVAMQRNVDDNVASFKQGPQVAQVRHLDLEHAQPEEPGRCRDGATTHPSTAGSNCDALCIRSWQSDRSVVP